MSRWITVRLTSDSWDISRWLGEAVRGAFPSDYTGETVRLSDVATVIPTREQLSSRRLVVTPGGVDPISGAITKAKSGVAATGCSLEGDLEPGDVLVPREGTTPCVFITKAHAHLAFSNFVPVRVDAKLLDATVLWAILTSTSGGHAREGRLRPAELLEILVPRLSADDGLISMIGLLRPSPAVDIAEPPVRPSDWARVELRPRDWWRPVAMVGVPLETGPRLGEMADLLVGVMPREEPFELEFADSLPVADPKWVRTGRSAQWHAKQDVTAVASGTVVLSIEGRFGARVVEHETGIGPGVIAIRPRPEWASISSAALAAYLNGDAAQIALAQLATGTAIPRLSTEALSNLHLPTEHRLLSLVRDPDPNVLPIAELLEGALWHS